MDLFSENTVVINNESYIFNEQDYYLVHASSKKILIFLKDIGVYYYKIADLLL